MEFQFGATSISKLKVYFRNITNFVPLENPKYERRVTRHTLHIGCANLVALHLQVSHLQLKVYLKKYPTNRISSKFA